MCRAGVSEAVKRPRFVRSNQSMVARTNVSAWLLCKPSANGCRHRRRVFDGREVSDVIEYDDLRVIGEYGLEFIGLPERYPRIIPTPADTNRAAGGFQSICHWAGVRCAECCDLPVERGLSDGPSHWEASASTSSSGNGRKAAAAMYSLTSAACRCAGSCSKTGALSATSRKKGDPHGSRVTTSQRNTSAYSTPLSRCARSATAPPMSCAMTCGYCSPHNSMSEPSRTACAAKSVVTAELFSDSP